MSESDFNWRAGHGDIGMLNSLIDLFEEARDVLKYYPDASFTIVSDPDRKNITFSIVVDHQIPDVILNRYIPNVNVEQSITLDCS